MGHKFTSTVAREARGEIDYLNDDLRVLLLAPGSDALEDESDAATLQDFTNLGEFADPAYQRLPLAPAGSNRTLVELPALKLVMLKTGEFLNWGAFDPGEVLAGALIYVHRSDNDDSQNWPVAVLDDGGFPRQTDSQPFLIQEPPGGWIQWQSKVAAITPPAE